MSQFTPQETDRIQVLDLHELRLLVYVDRQNRSMVYGGGRHVLTTVAVLRHLADLLEKTHEKRQKSGGSTQ